MKLYWATILLAASSLVACGGGGRSSNSNTPSGTSNPPSSGTPSATGTGSGLTAPRVVTVTGTANVPGNDIAVPATSPPLKSEVLGVVPPNSSGGSADNTGGVIQRGTTGTVLMFGPGLNGKLSVSVFGPQDLTIANVVGIKATDGTPGVQFDVTVNSNATPSARTVVLQDSSGNVTTFTGGLEIQ